MNLTALAFAGFKGGDTPHFLDFLDVFHLIGCTCPKEDEVGFYLTSGAVVRCKTEIVGHGREAQFTLAESS